VAHARQNAARRYIQQRTETRGALTGRIRLRRMIVLAGQSVASRLPTGAPVRDHAPGLLPVATAIGTKNPGEYGVKFGRNGLAGQPGGKVCDSVPTTNSAPEIFNQNRPEF
jgi:hypothetical protein